MSTTIDTLEPGRMIADYRIDSLLGSGSFGVTYRAHDVGLNRAVAIKEYMPFDYARRDVSGTVSSRSAETGGTFEWGLDRFSEEARTLAQFNHPNIVRVLRIVPDLNGTAYIVMEMLVGENMESLIERDGPLSAARFKAIFRQLLDGVGAIHAIGILHRDIKPANVVIRDDIPILIDFGAARDLAGQRKAGFSALVTDGFSPGEQYSRDQEQTAASDIYALAATGYYLLTGRIPPPAAARAFGDPLPPIDGPAAADLAPDILDGIAWGMALSIADRPASVAEWREKMPSLVDAPLSPTVIVQQIIGGQKIDRRALLIAGAGIVVAGGVGTFLLTRDTSIDSTAAPLKVAWTKTVAPLFGEPYASVAVTASGAIVAAQRLAADGAERLTALRIDDSGKTVGDFLLDEPGSSGHSILPTADGGAFVGGDAGGNAILIRLGPDWKAVWTKRYDPGSISSLMANKDGVIAGMEGPRTSGTAKLLFIDAQGARTSDAPLLDRQGDSVQRVIQLADGAILALGLRLEIRGGVEQSSLWLTRLTAAGEEVWRLYETGMGHTQGWDVVEAGGELFVTGRTSLAKADAPTQLLIMRVSAEGKKRWSRWDYPGKPSSGRGLAVTGGSSPRVYLAGWAGSPRAPRISQIALDGTLSWDQPLATTSGSGPGSSAAGLALRSDGTGFMIGLTSVTADDISLTVSRLITA